MKSFAWNLPTRIYYGENCIEDALKSEQPLLETKTVLLVTTGGSLIRFGYLDALREMLIKTARCRSVYVFERISPNPKLAEVEEAVSVAKEKDVEIVVGFGGGSAMDAAKAVAAGAGSQVNVTELLRNSKEPLPGQTLPIVAIPTTAGTGSELSRGAILSDPERQTKGGLRGDAILPTVAIVDPTYTWTIPERTTIETGFDVLAHAIESYCSIKATPYSEMLSEKAIRVTGNNLRRLRQNIENHEARAGMSFASMLMGLNLKDVGTCLPHRMQYPIGALTDTSHGAGLMALYPSWIKHEFAANPDRIQQVFAWLGYPSITEKEQAKSYMNAFLAEMGQRPSLRDLGIKEAESTRLAAMVTGNTGNDPAAQQSDIIEMIYQEAWM